MSLRLYAKDKRSYPELEGKQIKWSNSLYVKYEEFDAEILGCDYYIGVTIVSAKDKTVNLTCLNGPLSPRFKDSPMTITQLRIYNKKFKLMLLMFNEGFYDSDIRRTVLNERSYKHVGMNHCSFV